MHSGAGFGRRSRMGVVLILASLWAGRALAQAPASDRIDYLTLAQGAVPVSVGGNGQGASIETALGAADGNINGTIVAQRATAETEIEFVYALPALTTFDRFAVPEVLETPSPGQTFVRVVEVFGSATGPTEGFELLASAVLETHTARGQVTELRLVASLPVRWVRLRIAGGIQILQPQSFLEFSEIIGNGRQEMPALAETFHGEWRARGIQLDLQQKGATVSGCYDGEGDLTGTVAGNILRATGVHRVTGVPSLFVLSVLDDGSVRGVRSTNGAPFRMYEAASAPGAAGGCREIKPPALGCGSVVHGIAFDFDSADIRPESGPVLAELYEGLRADGSAAIVIEGHTSSEGTDDYNQRLSERRAQSVVADLVRRGLAAGRVTATGLGESRPMAPNTDETGRSLNRRVEVHCR